MKKASQGKSVLTQSDLKNITTHMKRIFPTREEMRLEIHDAEERLNESISHLPTKEEFFTRMDKLSGELKTMREEFALHSDEHRKINDRFERIDKHLGISTLE
ncbi:hypothetical protein M1555_02035 [Patescibacteria group bacterium]|nr:hypothetical protein [Patescibacteria group bacterium]